jgi:hypothetical protein
MYGIPGVGSLSSLLAACRPALARIALRHRILLG